MIAGAGVGLLIGLAILLVAAWQRDRRPLPLTLRIGPYVGIPGTALASTSRGRASLGSLVTRLTGASTADDVVRSARAGEPGGAAAHRARRLAWSAVGAATGLLLGVLLAAGGATALLPVVLAATGAVGGWLACDARLTRRARTRQERIRRQLPMLADLVALSVTAGAGPVDALASAAATLGPPVSVDVSHAVADVRSGRPVDASLRDLARLIDLAPLHRFVDAIVVALETGSPLADVARAQAIDLRVEERRHLMESAGRRDVLMLVPIVFLVLPSVVMVALLPGLQALRLVLP